jgi:hypothetical protein
MKRIQRKCTKGWRMPENTVYVGLGTKWANPIKLVGDMVYIDAGYRRKIMDKWVILEQAILKESVILLFKVLFTEMKLEKDLSYWQKHFKSLDLSELKGKNLACFCKEDEPCHADILLKLANK